MQNGNCDYRLLLSTYHHFSMSTSFDGTDIDTCTYFVVSKKNEPLCKNTFAAYRNMDYKSDPRIGDVLVAYSRAVYSLGNVVNCGSTKYIDHFTSAEAVEDGAPPGLTLCGNWNVGFWPPKMLLLLCFSFFLLYSSSIIPNWTAYKSWHNYCGVFNIMSS